MTVEVAEVTKHTVWIIEREVGGFTAVNYLGEAIAVSKHKNSLEHKIKQMAHDPANNIWAVASVIMPRSRQPHRKPRKTINR